MLFMFSIAVFSQTDSTTVRDNFEQTDQVLSKILDKSLKLAEQTGDFVITQAPDVLRQFYIWHTVEYIVMMLLGSVVILIGRYLPHLWQQSKGSYTSKFFNIYVDDDAGIMVAYGVFIIGLISGGFIFITNLMDLLYITLAPKLYLIDYLLKLRN